jgi:hypothetical protein
MAFMQKPILGTKAKDKTPKPKTIKETKCTCTACGKVWFFGMKDAVENASNALNNFNKQMLCCGGCFLPSLLMKEREVKDMNKCPQCGSRAIKKESVAHEIQP